MLMSILVTIRAVTLFNAVFNAVLYVVVLGVVAFVAISFIATQIMDIYEAKTGESWKSRCDRLKNRRNEL